MKRQLDDPTGNTSNSSKIHLNEEMEKKELRMRDIQKEIALKYNLNIKNDIRKIETEQEQKVLNYVAALGKSQA